MSPAVCLFVAGSLAATLPEGEFTLAWTHSVARTTWVERYRAEAEGLRVAEASVEGTGAGMEPPADAVFADGRWTWRPDRRVPELSLQRSGYASDYTLCTAGRCAALAEWVGPAAPGAAVILRPCAAQRLR